MSGHHRDAESYWDDDQRMALGRSHGRTIASLEERAYDSDRVSKRPKPRTKRHQIVPSKSDIQTEVEEARQRTNQLHQQSKIVKDDKSGESYRVISYKNFSHFVTEDTEDESGQSPSKRVLSKKKLSFLLCASIVLIGASIVLILPTTRNAIDNVMKDAFEHTEAVFARTASRKQELFQTSSLRLTLGSDEGSSNNVHYGNLYSPSYHPIADTVPVLWGIPNTGGNSVRDILSYCLQLTFADERGTNHEDEEYLQIITDADNIAHYVNVDMFSEKDIARADRLGLVDSGLGDIFATTHIAELSKLFLDRFKTGRMFAVLKHPVKRAVADFVTEKASNEALQKMHLYQYAQSAHVHENVMVKEIANVTGTISTEDVLTAKAILENFVVVGLADHFEESLTRFYNYFGWTKEGEWEACQSNFLAVMNYQTHDEEVAENTDEYGTLADRNWADMELYNFAVDLFTRQKMLAKVKA